MLRRASAIVTALVLALAVSGTALAHAELETGTPGPDETVTEVPTELTATFTAELDPAKSSIVVKDPGGTEVARGQADTVQADGLSMVVPLPALANGTYTVEWTGTALEDGHIERGTYSFTVAVATSPSPSPPSSPSSSPSPRPSASPAPSPSPSPSPSAAASPSAAPSPTPSPSDPAAGIDPAVVLPIAVAIVVVGIVALTLVRRRPT